MHLPPHLQLHAHTSNQQETVTTEEECPSSRSGDSQHIRTSESSWSEENVEINHFLQESHLIHKWEWGQRTVEIKTGLIETEEVESILFLESASKLLYTPIRIAKFSECELLKDEISENVPIKPPFEVRVFDNRGKDSRLKVKYIFRAIATESFKNLTDAHFREMMLGVLFQARMLGVREIGVYLLDANDSANSSFIQGVVPLFAPGITSHAINRLVFVNRESINYHLGKAMRLYIKPEDKSVRTWISAVVDPISFNQLQSRQSHQTESRDLAEVGPQTGPESPHSERDSALKRRYTNPHSSLPSVAPISTSSMPSGLSSQSELGLRGHSSHKSFVSNPLFAEGEVLRDQASCNVKEKTPNPHTFKIQQVRPCVSIASFHLGRLDARLDDLELVAAKVCGVLTSVFAEASIICLQSVDQRLLPFLSKCTGDAFDYIVSKPSNPEIAHLTPVTLYRKNIYERIEKHEDVLVWGGIHQCILLQARHSEYKGKRYSFIVSNISLPGKDSSLKTHHTNPELPPNPFIQSTSQEAFLSNEAVATSRVYPHIQETIYSVQKNLLSPIPVLICGALQQGLDLFSSRFEAAPTPREKDDSTTILYSTEWTMNAYLEVDSHVDPLKEYGSRSFPQFIELLLH